MGVFSIVKDGKEKLLKSLMDTLDMLHKTSYSGGKKWIDQTSILGFCRQGK